MTIWGMHIACWIPKATNTHTEYLILIAFSTATLEARKLLNVTSYVNCLSFYATDFSCSCIKDIFLKLDPQPHT